MLCFRCGSYNVDDATKCDVCGQAFLDEKGRAMAGVQRRPTGAKLVAAIFAPGEVVSGRYQILGALGQGGVGTVYRARDQELDVDIALKAISPNLLQTDEEQQLFSRQMRQARKLNHPNIIRIHDEGHEGPRRYFTMKLLEGLTLRKIIRLRHDKSQAFSPEEIVPIFHQLAAALDYAHKTTWHGDLKPENVIILPDVLKVTDFNLVKGLPLKPFLGIAKSRSKGFPYIAPELRVEANQIDGRADIYSLGVILGEMLTGLVFEGHFTRAFTAALEQLPPKVDGLVRRAVAEHPDGRFPKASELARELEAALSKMPPDGLPVPAKAVSPSGALPPRKSTPAAPPPPPLETSPGQPLPAGGLAPVGDGEPEEIGQSQVLLIDGAAVHPQTSDEGQASTSDLEAEPDRSRDMALRAEGIVETMFTSEEGGLVPPPLPEDGPVDVSDSHSLGPGSPSHPHPSDELTTLADEVPGAIAEEDDEEEETRPDLHGVGLHEELTALKPHPLHDLMEPSDEELLPPLALDSSPEDDDPAAEETMTVAQLEAAKERSSPRLHAPEGVTPPVVRPNQPGHVPPTLRPVAPPERKKSAAGRYLWLAAGLVIVLGLVFGVQQGLFSGDAKPGAVTARVDGSPAVVSPPPVASDAGRTEDPAIAPGQSQDASKEPQADNEPKVEEPKVEEPKVEEPKVEEPKVGPDRSPAKDGRGRDDSPKRPSDERLAVEARLRAEMESREEAERQRREQEKRLAALREKAGEDERREEGDKRNGREAPKEVAVVSPNPTCPRGMKLIAGGKMTFGSSPSDPMRNFGENLATSLDIGAFCIDYYEHPNGAKQPPTTGVTWGQAKAVCERKGKRLCTEAEWERACKGPGNRRFPYGNSWNPGVCNTEDEQGKPRSVQSAAAFPKCRSAYNVFAMAGNVEEWTADSFRPGAPSKTVKGGAADRPNWASRCAARRGVSPKTSNATLGFRCCADVK